MPLLINAVSKITNKGVIITNPNKDILYKHLTNGNSHMDKPQITFPRKHYADIRTNNMTTEQKRKYLMLKYIRQYT